MIRTPAADPRIEALCRLVFNFRVVVLILTALALFDADHRSGAVAGAIVVAAVMTVLPILEWERIGPLLMRHPLFVAVDLVAAMVLLATTGTGSPLYSYTLGVALLAGVLHGTIGTLVFSPFLVVGYFAGIDVGSGASFQEVVGLPALYPVAALSGAAVRRLIERQIRTEAALRSVVAAGEVERERTRIAREMHDSVAKTLQGMSFQARAVARWIDKDPARARDELSALEAAAATAADEGRRLIKDLRTDALESPFADIVHAVVERWGHTGGVEGYVEVSGALDPSPDVRWELLQILGEALTNIGRHADARRAEVTVTAAGDEIVLRVSDDGRGMNEGRRDGHYGLVGMEERARRVGGRLEVASAPEEGTTIVARVPGAAADQIDVTERREASPA